MLLIIRALRHYLSPFGFLDATRGGAERPALIALDFGLLRPQEARRYAQREPLPSAETFPGRPRGMPSGVSFDIAGMITSCS